MKRLFAIFIAASLLAGCAKQQQAVEASLDDPVDCITAEGDIRVLENEKANAAEQVAAGISAIAPIGLVSGLLTGTEDTKLRVASGAYDEALDTKIAEIKATCNLQ